MGGGVWATGQAGPPPEQPPAATAAAAAATPPLGSGAMATPSVAGTSAPIWAGTNLLGRRCEPPAAAGSRAGRTASVARGKAREGPFRGSWGRLAWRGQSGLHRDCRPI